MVDYLIPRDQLPLRRRRIELLKPSQTQEDNPMADEKPKFEVVQNEAPALTPNFDTAAYFKEALIRPDGDVLPFGSKGERMPCQTYRLSL
jgi:hypothetical protein